MATFKLIRTSTLSMFKIWVQAVVKFDLDRGTKNEHSRSYANFLQQIDRPNFTLNYPNF